MKIALLIILTLTYKQTTAGCCGKSKSKNNIKLDCSIKEGTKDVNVKEVKGEHMIKHIFTAKGGKQITKIKVGNSNVAKVVNDMDNKSYISSVEVYRSNRGEKIYLIKLFIKTDSDDVIIYLYKFTSGWKIVKMGFVHYIIGKLERGEKFEDPIHTTYQKELEKHLKEGATFTSSATGTDIKVDKNRSQDSDRTVTVADKLKLKLYYQCSCNSKYICTWCNSEVTVAVVTEVTSN